MGPALALALVLAAGAVATTEAYVNLMWPTSRFGNPTGVAGAQASVFPTLLEAAGGCPNFGCLWLNHGCQPGCRNCSDVAGGPVSPGTLPDDTCSEPGATMPPTATDPALRTYRDTAHGGDWTRRNPWRSPGHAPVASACGLAGGGASPGSWTSPSLTRHIRSGAVTPPFVRRGFDATEVPAGPKAVWRRGSVQEVAWSIFDNHGGGYAYRLCPNTGDPSTLTEACFQAHHLAYASDTSYIQYGSNRTNRTAFSAVRTSSGTHPQGSAWTKNPIPPCAGADGSPVQSPQDCTEPMFAPILPTLYGDGPGMCITWAIHGPVEGYQTLFDSFGNVVYQAPCTRFQGLDLALHFQFNIFDEVIVPKDLATGDYVLSFRLDAEQTPQIWTHCSDITITD